MIIQAEISIDDNPACCTHYRSRPSGNRPPSAMINCLLAIYTTGLAGDPPRVDRIAGMAPGPRSMPTSTRPPAPSRTAPS